MEQAKSRAESGFFPASPSLRSQDRNIQSKMNQLQHLVQKISLQNWLTRVMKCIVFYSKKGCVSSPVEAPCNIIF